MSDEIREIVKSTLGVDPKLSDQEIAEIGLLSASGAYAFSQAEQVYSNYIRFSGVLSVSDPRERMANQLLRRGYGSVDEVLKSSFGEWPPKGLDIVMENPQQVRFGNIVERASDMPAKGLLGSLGNKLSVINGTFGDATLTGERVIRMNDFRLSRLPGLMGGSALSSTMGHEGVHILQGDNYYRAAQIYGYRDAAKVFDRQQMVLGQNDAAAKVFEDHTNESFTKGLSKVEMKHFDYVRSGVETQARIHQVMMEGYQRWRQLPANREQFLVAMKNSGLDVPQSVMSELEKSPTITETKHIFSSTKPVSTAPARDINFVQTGLTDTGKMEFWNKAMPELYTDLIEMYGDGPGRARFDLGQNLRPALKARIDATHPIVASYEQFKDAYEKGHPNADIMVAPGAKDAPPISAGVRQVDTKGIRGGIITNVVIGAGAGIVAYALGSDLKDSGKITFQTAVPYGETALKIAEGDKKGAIHATMTETAGIGGAIGGAMAGAAIGSAVPVVGTVIGAVAGGIIGGVGAGMGTDVLLTKVPKITDTVKTGVDSTMTYVSGTASTVKQTASRAFDTAANATQDAKQYVSDAYNSLKGQYTSWFNRGSGAETPASALTSEQAYKGLPTKSSSNMPPEVQSLIEVKGSKQRFQQQFEELKKQGSLAEVEKYIKIHPAADSPDPAASVVGRIPVQQVLLKF